MHPLALILRNPRQTVAIAVSLAAIAGVAAYRMTRRKPTPEELEATRRSFLAANGHITDGSLLDATPNLTHPHTLIYSYSVGGVEYECTQDISALIAGLKLTSPGLPNLDVPLLDLPVQVRYNIANPGDSIVVAETWNGLWSLPRTGSQ